MTHAKQIMNPKRSKAERGGLHAWHPYYAGYSEQFVQSALEFLDIGEGQCVLDPWSGSGTTNFVCAKMGVSSVGYEINPAIGAYAAAKHPNNVTVGEDLSALLEEIKLNAQALRSDVRLTNGDLEFMDETLALTAKAAIQGIGQWSNRCEESANEFQAPLEPRGNFLLAGTYRVLRNLSGFKKGKNPTWYSKTSVKTEVGEDEFWSSLGKVLHEMAEDISKVEYKKPYSRYEIFCGDFLKESATEKFDGIITSPPYLTRIDYAMSTKLEIVTSKGEEGLRSIREASLGSPIILKEIPVVLKEWGEVCLSVLEKIENHNTKAAKSYYWKNIVQYFDQAFESIKRFEELLTPKAGALVVVQSSYFKDIYIPLSEIYCEMARSVGFKAEVVFERQVKTHLAHVNTKSRNYVEKKKYTEDVVYIRK